MEIIFTKDGYRVDDGELSIRQLYDLAFDSAPPEDPALAFLVCIAESLVDRERRDPDLSLTRKASDPEPAALFELLCGLPYTLGAEFVDTDWIGRIYGELAAVFDAELAAFEGTPEAYFHSKNTALTVSGRVFFHLVETKEESFPFAFLATYSTKVEGAVRHLPLKRALEEFGGDQKALLGLLSTVSKAANDSALISSLTESGELFHPLKFEPRDAYDFLREVPFYEECGIICRIPDFWKRKSKARLSLTLGAGEPSLLGMDSLLSFTPSLFLGDVELSRAEMEELLSQDSGLAFLKGKWVEVNGERIRQVLDALDRMEDQGQLSFADAIKIQAGITEGPDQEEDTQVQVTNGQWLADVFEKLASPARIEPVAPSGDFRADLRHYQQTGLNWLHFMRSLGFGALLADDMGLGKTVQILALLDKLRENAPETKSLLVVPASLLVNWQKEAARFAPKLRLSVIHGDNQALCPEDADLFVTTYGMVARLESLAGFAWHLLILDESQAIKNPGVKQTKAVKALQAQRKIAMTGTPIENRLGDLWSLFDFLNPGLLGTSKEFTQYAKRLRESPAGYARLRGALSPFILRRLKTDRSVISDLPEKNEIKQYTTLTKKQVALYTALVKELGRALQKEREERTQGAEIPGIARKGRILAAIMKFKQICNHPDQYVGQTGFDPKHSGKFAALAEICETIRDKHESVLVFTQFREMCAPLSDYLATVFGREGLVIHGQTTPKKRGEIVEEFNTRYVPFMVLSLKAGGVGLNLTAANHVIHFDRWWNPAIENQATDRAFRIGQTKDVMVYKFVTSGTIEEKIDTMIESKQQLSRDVIAESSGEDWVTEMSDADLMQLFKLEV
ncbi:MAG: DEAD/DEAH box helicase [Lachnospiraceae bacterium]|nr:DEAD/DEAH box helicase [Lachnospiraceae bacterium]